METKEPLFSSSWIYETQWTFHEVTGIWIGPAWRLGRRTHRNYCRRLNEERLSLACVSMCWPTDWWWIVMRNTLAYIIWCFIYHWIEQTLSYTNANNICHCCYRVSFILVPLNCIFLTNIMTNYLCIYHLQVTRPSLCFWRWNDSAIEDRDRPKFVWSG